MAINANIALGGRGVEVADPVQRYGQMQQLMAGQDAQRMNAMKMQEAERGIQNTNAMNRAYSESLSPETGQLDYNMLMKNMAASGQGSGIPNVMKQQQERQTAQTTQQKSQFDLAKAKREFVAQAQRDTSRNPSDANITAFKEDLMMNPAFTAAEKTQMAAGADRILAMPVEQRQAFMESQGASAGERMQQGTATANREQTAATALAGQQSTAATALAGQGVTMRGQNMTAGTAAAGQDIQRRAQRLAQQKFEQESDPQFAQKMEVAKAQGRLSATNDVEAKAVLPGVIASADNVVRLIDTMIGKRNDKGELLPGEKPHKGFANAVGFGFPGARYIPGTPAADFQSYFNQVNGTAFLQAFETLKGGGQITEIEGLKATQAINRMDTATTEKEFINASRDFQGVVKAAVGRAKDKVKTLGTPASSGGGVDTSNPLLR